MLNSQMIWCMLLANHEIINVRDTWSLNNTLTNVKAV